MLESFSVSLSPSLCLTSLSLRENSNLRHEQTLRTLAEERSSNEWQCATFLPLLSSHLPFFFFADLRISDSPPQPAFADALTRLLFTRVSIPSVICLWKNFFICSTRGCSVRESFGSFSARRPIAITDRTEWRQPFATSVLYCHPLNFFSVLFSGSAIVKRRAPRFQLWQCALKETGTLKRPMFNLKLRLLY